MVAVITGDIIDSRKIEGSSHWNEPLDQLFKLKKLAWEVFRGDSFQVEIPDPQKSLALAIHIKAVLRSIKLDARMAVGLGDKQQDAKRVGMRTGTAYYNSGEAFESLKAKNQNILIKSGEEAFDRDINTMLKLALVFMDTWTANSAEVTRLLLEKPALRQIELGQLLTIDQSSVSARIKRANFEEISELLKTFQLKVKEVW